MKEVEELACPFCGYARPRVKPSAEANPVCPRCGHFVGDAFASGPVPSDLLSDLESQARELEVEKLELEQWLNEETRLADEDQSRVSMVNLREKIGRLARQHRGAGERLHLLRSEYQGLQQQLETVASNVELYTPDVAVLKQQQADLQEQISSAEIERLTDLTKQLEDKLATEHGLRMTAAQRIDVLERALREADQDRKTAEDLRHRHRKIQTEVDRLQKECDRLHAEREVREQTAQKLESRIDELTKERLDQRRQHAEQERKTADLAQRAEAHIASTEKLHEVRQQQQRVLQQQLEEMALAWETRQHEFEHTRGENQTLSVRNRALEVDLAAASRRSEETEQRIAELERDHDRAEFEHSVVAKLEEANRELQADHAQHEQTYLLVQEQLQAAEDARHEVDAARSALQQRVDQLNHDADRERSERVRLAEVVRRLTAQVGHADRLRVEAEDRATALEARPTVDPVLESAVQDLKSRNADLVRERSRLEDELARMRNRLQSQIEAADRSVRQVETLHAQNRRLQEDFEKMDARVKMLREIETDLRAVAESVPPLEHQIQVLERENHALMAQSQETRRSLSDAATVVTQVTALRSELERLGKKYLQAREEIARGQSERMSLRDELSELADRVLSERREETGYSAAEVARARKQIRGAILKHLQPGPVDLSPEP